MSTAAIDLTTLKEIPLFSRLSQRSLEALAPALDIEQFDVGTLVFAEGQQGHRMYIVLDGAVQITREIRGVGEEQLAMARKGDYFGELSLLDDSPRSANARVLETATLLSFRKADLEERMFQDSAFAQEILWVFTRHLAIRLRETNEKLRALHQMNL